MHFGGGGGAAAGAAGGVAAAGGGLCPTSNLKTLSLNGHHEHSLAPRWIREGYLFSINTDDVAVFATTLSAEFAAMAGAHGWVRRSWRRRHALRRGRFLKRGCRCHYKEQ
ncbi:unnamed protein product [Phaeothamnion confervicola]